MRRPRLGDSVTRSRLLTIVRAGVAVAALTTLLAGCATAAEPAGSQGAPSDPPSPATATAQPEAVVDEPDSANVESYEDSWGGSGGTWTIDPACPDKSVAAAVTGVTTFEMNGTETQGGCRYFDVTVPAAISVFFADNETRLAIGVGATVTPAQAPSLGETATVVTDSGFQGCTAYVPLTEDDDWALAVTAIAGNKPMEQSCADAVAFLKAVAQQA